MLEVAQRTAEEKGRRRKEDGEGVTTTRLTIDRTSAWRAKGKSHESTRAIMKMAAPSAATDYSAQRGGREGEDY